jgi:flagellar hook protein FlgE
MADIGAIALSGLTASETRLSVAATNVANALTPGYKTLDVNQSTNSDGTVATNVVYRAPAVPALSPNSQGNSPTSQGNTVQPANVSTDNSDDEVIKAQATLYTFQANLKVLKVQDDMQQSLLDITV